MYAVLLLLPSIVRAVDPRDLYSYANEASEVLPRGDEEFQYMDLDMPAYFYNEKYDRVYVSLCLKNTFDSWTGLIERERK